MLVTCEYDVTASPQGMRWVMLSRGLAQLGWEVDVVTFATANGQQTRTGAEAGRVSVHGVFPGLYQALIMRLQRRRAPSIKNDGVPGVPGAAPKEAVTLNWKGRIDDFIRRQSTRLLYPDLRREGLPYLRRHVNRLAMTNQYSAAILSHEPPLALELCDMLRAAGLPVVIDLGDPVLAAYTPPQWQGTAAALEAKACKCASAVVVTSEATKDLLLKRHPGIAPAGIEVVTQGFQPVDVPSRIRLAGGRGQSLRLVYTGRFYRFRDPREVIDAVAATPGVVMAMAVPQMPEWIHAGSLAPPSFEMHGCLPHRQAMDLQASADILLVIGNDDPTQTPGKLFEYFGVARPVLYVARHPDDSGARLLMELKRGLVVPADPQAIASALTRLLELKDTGSLDSHFDLSDARVAAYAWPALAERYSRLIGRVISGTVESRATDGAEDERPAP